MSALRPSPLYGSTQEAAAATFSLVRNPFAILGATTRTPQADLPDLAERVGTPEAAAALRVVSVPRTRLGAEVAFLPGAAEATPGVVSALSRGERVNPLSVPQAARVNVLAHLCAACLATAEDQAALPACQAAPGDAALVQAINTDRAAAGVPPLQPAALSAEQDALSDQHAAALLASCLDGADPAGRLSDLVRGAPDGPPSAFLRKVTSAWARHSTVRLGELAELAATTAREVRRQPDATNVGALVQAARGWAACSQPQRLSDARAGLDHGPTLRASRPWRDIGAKLANDGRPDLALPLAQALAEVFGDLPGEAVQLRDEARACAGMVEDQTLEARLAPLRTLAERIGDWPGPLAAALSMGPFGPKAVGAAAELWAVFDAACTACVASEAPWTIVRALAHQIGGEHRLAGAGIALALQRGMVARAEAAGFAPLADRLRAEQRGLQRGVAKWEYLQKAEKAKHWWNGGTYRRWRALGALRRVLPLVDDPGERATLQTEERKLARGVRLALISQVSVFGGLAALVAVYLLDQNYSENAPYRRAAPQAVAIAPGIVPLTRLVRPDAPALAPEAPVVPPIAPVPPLSPAKPLRADGGPKAPAPEAAVLAFPARTALPEHRPRIGTTQLRTLPEMRWCLFNDVRLKAALDAAGPDNEASVRALMDEWSAVCDTYDARRRDVDQASAELARNRDRAQAEGRGMLLGSP